MQEISRVFLMVKCPSLVNGGADVGKAKASTHKSDRLDYIKRYELELKEGFTDIHWDIEKGTLEFENRGY